ncbi:hypothetical protein MVEN_00494100 [Mycena venus]|uniref:F-box domain-containing protein n=1 Tax=Mycena venus TaxID=2733690 RepID=A0A8H6YXL9_9AGAR|nr:hypothetical protein MVEN_00494100 [Mycena venus]
MNVFIGDAEILPVTSIHRTHGPRWYGHPSVSDGQIMIAGTASHHRLESRRSGESGTHMNSSHLAGLSRALYPKGSCTPRRTQEGDADEMSPRIGQTRDRISIASFDAAYCLGALLRCCHVATMPTQVAQELLDAIVSDLDAESLKACSLAASSLRNASQRTLFRSLTLGKRGNGYPPGYGAALCVLLKDSPHVTQYISRLVIYTPLLYLNRSAEELPNIGVALSKLVNVRQCTIHGNGSPRFYWQQLTPEFSSIFLDFIARQALRELHVTSMEDIPPPAFVRLITAAPLLSFSFVSIKDSVEHSPMIVPANGSAIKTLILDTEALTVSKYLVRSEFTPYIATLRHLGTISDDVNNNKLISSSTRTLHHLRLYFPGPQAAAIRLPSLPALQSLELSTAYRFHGQAWFLSTIYSVVNRTTTPLLTELILTLFPMAPRIPCSQPKNIPHHCLANCQTAAYRSDTTGSVPDPVFLNALDATLAEHPAGPSVRWRLTCIDDDIPSPTSCRRCSAACQRLTRKGRLVVQQYARQGGVVNGLPYPLSPRPS